MTSIFDNATFGSLFETEDGHRAVYIKHILYNDTHKILVDGFEQPMVYVSDGRRRGGGRYASSYGPTLHIKQLLRL